MLAMLKQSTAVTVPFGPFLDETTGKDVEGGLTIAQADIRVNKNGAGFAQTNNAAGAPHDEAGWYGVPLDTTDTGTLGLLTVAIHKSGALPVWKDFIVVPTNVWDSYLGADRLQVDVREDAVNPLAPAIADAVWDEAIADHLAAGSTGAKLNTAGSAADPLENTVPGDYSSGTAGHALGRIGSGQIATTSVVADTGKVTIVKGDDYANADGRALDWTDVNNTWPVLTDATIALTVRRGAQAQTVVLEKAGAVATPTGDSKKVRVELAAADTDIRAGNYRYDIQATLSGGNIVTLVRVENPRVGFIVQEDYTR